MNRLIASFIAVGSILFSGFVISQQVTTPEMMLRSFSDIEPQTINDGRRVRRVSASTVSLIRVEWPEGTTATPHNHAYELVLSVVEGRLRAISGNQEFIMEAGDIAVVPAWVEHGYVALEDSITLEAAGPG